MSEQTGMGTEEQSLLERLNRPAGRRTFLKWSGVSAAALAVGACEDTEIVRPEDLPGAAVTLDFSDDFGVLNYAYALEQLEAAFYTQAVETPFAGMTADERSVLEDLRDHEIAHREFFAAALGDNAIPALVPDFSAVNFNDRTSVLTTAQTFEDLGVWAYNGAGQFLTNPDFLRIAGKIVSVEARHAAAIRQILQPASDLFSVVDDAGLDEALVPSEVLPLAQPFIRTIIQARNLPAGA